MIIDFTVTNFRSIRDKQTLSMHAQGASSIEPNVYFPSAENIGVLRSIGIYGANASGKSNFLLALNALRYLVRNTGSLQDDVDIECYEPFLLCSSTKNAPIKFEIECYIQGVRFLYSISFNVNSILEESLDYYPSRHKANLFNRKESDTWETVSFGSHLKGGRRKFAFFKNNSYLSKAGNSADAPLIIRNIYNYFRHDITHLAVGQDFKISSFLSNANVRSVFAAVLKNSDTGISDIEAEDQEEEVLNALNSSDHPEEYKEAIKEYALTRARFKPFFLHENDTGGFERFSESMESAGTLKLFNLLPLLIACFHNGGVLIVDELDNSLHIHLAELIVKLFHDQEVNKKGAQLIFSTHNINLMSHELMRRDQIWFCEKKQGVSNIFSLDQFDKKIVKSNSPFIKWYGEGRFGGIPHVDYKAIATLMTVVKD